jgi:hypothetical protein
MADIWIHPGFQAGVLPGAVALIVFALLIRFRGVVGVAVLAAFVSTVAVTTGLSFEPLTSTRKILLIGLLSPLLGVVYEWVSMPKWLKSGSIALIAGGCIIWVLWPYLQRTDVENLMFTAVGLTLFVAWMALAFSWIAQRPIIAGTAVLTAGGFGVGLSALLGASAMLGQWGIALGAAGASGLIVSLLTKKSVNAGAIFVTTSGLLLALIAAAAVVYAKLPWYTLPILAIIPLMAQIRLDDAKSKYFHAAIWLVTGFLLAAVSVYLTWKAEGNVPI